MANKRNYKEEYKYHQTPAEKKRRAGRNKARRAALAAGKVKKGDNKDVHHKDGNPRNNKSSNVAVVSRKKNRGKYRFA
jgi:DNA replication protein DnaC